MNSRYDDGFMAGDYHAETIEDLDQLQRWHDDVASALGYCLRVNTETTGRYSDGDIAWLEGLIDAYALRIASLTDNYEVEL